MGFIDSNAIQLWAVQFLVVLFLAGGLVALGVGVGLIVESAGTLRLLAALNRWVSTRRVTRPLDVNHDTRALVQRYRHWLAVPFIAGAGFAIFGLATQFDVRAVGFAFGLDTRPSTIASWLVESLRWALIVGNLAAVVIGILLAFFPGALIALEARGSRWYSERQLVSAADKMNFSLDHWVAASPRSAGWIITIASLILVIDFAILLFGIR